MLQIYNFFLTLYHFFQKKSLPLQLQIPYLPHTGHALRIRQLQAPKIMFSDNEIRDFLLGHSDDALFAKAAEVRHAFHGNKVHARGLIEISNFCRNNCLYCGIRSANSDVCRFRLTKEEVLDCCHRGAKLGFRTFVLQGGEDPLHSAEFIADIVSEIHSLYPQITIALSLGERPECDYRLWHEAGAKRYLLRHEAASPDLYGRLHPRNMSLENRINCLLNLREIGFEIGAGMMIGAPFQTIDDLVADVQFLGKLKPDMVGMGPFIHAQNTPFAEYPDGELLTSLRLISIVRILLPEANIPATTALASICPEGTDPIDIRIRAFEAGANVIMPNLSPSLARKNYSLYNNKVSTDLEDADNRPLLTEILKSRNYELL